MPGKDKLIDEIVLQKNSLVEGLTEDEKKEVDIYLEALLKEMSSAFYVADKLHNDKEKRKNIANVFKSEIEEQKWLEKLSKTFYDQEITLETKKIQKE